LHNSSKIKKKVLYLTFIKIALDINSNTISFDINCFQLGSKNNVSISNSYTKNNLLNFLIKKIYKKAYKFHKKNNFV